MKYPDLLQLYQAMKAKQKRKLAELLATPKQRRRPSSFSRGDELLIERAREQRISRDARRAKRRVA